MPLSPTLMGIPPEIRDQVLKLVLQADSDRPLRVGLKLDGQLERATVSPGENRGPSLSIAILLTCKQLYKEACPHLYQNSLILVWDKISPINFIYGPQLSTLLLSIDIESTNLGQAFGFPSLIKSFASKFPNLQQVNISFEGPTRFLAALFELTRSICPSSSLFQGPRLEILIFEAPLDGPEEQRPLRAVHKIIRPEIPKLADIGSMSNPYGSQLLTNWHAPELKVIQITGKLSQDLIGMVRRHTCSTGHCFFKLDWADPVPSPPLSPLSVYDPNRPWAQHVVGPPRGPPRRHAFSWQGGRAVPPPPECDMSQFLPPLPVHYHHHHPLEFVFPARVTQEPDDQDSNSDSHSTIEDVQNNVAPPNLHAPLGGPPGQLASTLASSTLLGLGLTANAVVNNPGMFNIVANHVPAQNVNPAPATNVNPAPATNVNPPPAQIVNPAPTHNTNGAAQGTQTMVASAPLVPSTSTDTGRNSGKQGRSSEEICEWIASLTASGSP